jgi:hypothetical protein
MQFKFQLILRGNDFLPAFLTQFLGGYLNLSIDSPLVRFLWPSLADTTSYLSAGVQAQEQEGHLRQPQGSPPSQNCL